MTLEMRHECDVTQSREATGWNRSTLIFNQVGGKNETPRYHSPSPPMRKIFMQPLHPSCLLPLAPPTPRSLQVVHPEQTSHYSFQRRSSLEPHEMSPSANGDLTFAGAISCSRGMHLTEKKPIAHLNISFIFIHFIRTIHAIVGCHV